ncbi:hypothetical protein ABKV19_006616, partial [Rosa sericea]
QSRERDIQRAMARRAPWSPENAQHSIVLRNMGLVGIGLLFQRKLVIEMWQELQNKMAQLSQQGEWMIIKQRTSSTKVVSSVLASIRLIDGIFTAWKQGKSERDPRLELTSVSGFDQINPKTMSMTKSLSQFAFKFCQVQRPHEKIMQSHAHPSKLQWLVSSRHDDYPFISRPECRKELNWCCQAVSAMVNWLVAEAFLAMEHWKEYIYLHASKCKLKSLSRFNQVTQMLNERNGMHRLFNSVVEAEVAVENFKLAAPSNHQHITCG